MNHTEWSSLIAKFPPGMSGAEIARQIKQPPQLTAYWLKRLKYSTVDGRTHPKPEKFDKIRRVNQAEIDWSESNNSVLASRHGISRERIRQLRKQAMPPFPAETFRKLIASRVWPAGMGHNR